MHINSVLLSFIDYFYAFLFYRMAIISKRSSLNYYINRCFRNFLVLLICLRNNIHVSINFKFVFKKYRYSYRNVRLKPIHKIFIYIVFTIVIVYMFKYFFKYDMVKEALKKQNISRTRLTCENTRLVTNDHKTLLSKIDVFNKFYFKEFDNGIKSIPINFTDNILIDKKLNAQMRSFHFCSINPRSMFISETINKSQDIRDILYKKVLTKLDLDFLSSETGLITGGYYRAPLCIQDLLYYAYITLNDSLNMNAINSLGIINGVTRFYKNRNPVHKIKDIYKLIYPLILDLVEIDRNLIRNFKEYKQQLTIIIVPYLNRSNNLIDLLYNLHSFLQRQYLHYKIIIAEQYNSDDPFNKGRLFNTAFKYVEENYDINGKDSSKLKVNCLILHDVDLIPESDHNIYECDYDRMVPRHLSLSIRKQGYFSSYTYKENLYELLIGGVLAISPQAFKTINGFSNEFWNWGGEDDGKFDFFE